MSIAAADLEVKGAKRLPGMLMDGADRNLEEEIMA
jgi:hypothetical protein